MNELFMPRLWIDFWTMKHELSAAFSEPVLMLEIRFPFNFWKGVSINREVWWSNISIIIFYNNVVVILIFFCHGVLKVSNEQATEKFYENCSTKVRNLLFDLACGHLWASIAPKDLFLVISKSKCLILSIIDRMMVKKIIWPPKCSNLIVLALHHAS